MVLLPAGPVRTGGGTLRTVLVDTALLRDERDERRLVRELLRSTSCAWRAIGRSRLGADPSTLVVDPVALLRIEAVRRGKRFLDAGAGLPALGGARSDRLRSSPVLPFFTISRLAMLGLPVRLVFRLVVGGLADEPVTATTRLLFVSDP